MLEFHTVCIRNRVIAADKIKVYRFVLNHFYLCILGKVEHNRPRSTTLCYIKGTCYRPSHIFGTTNLIAPLANRLSDTYQIDFLKSICTQHRSRCLTGNHYDRSTVNHGISYTSNGIGCSRTTRYQTHAHFSRDTGKTLSCMSRSLLVTH